MLLKSDMHHGGRLLSRQACALLPSFTAFEGLCDALDCQPGDLLRWEPGEDEPAPA